MVIKMKQPAGSLLKCHRLLVESYKNHGYVSTPLLQHVFGIPYEEALEIVNYADMRGWIAPEETGTFERPFRARPHSRKKLSEDEILALSSNLNKKYIPVLLNHVEDNDGFLLSEAMEELKAQGPAFAFSALKEKRSFLYLEKFGVILVFGDLIIVNISRESLFALRDLLS